MLRIRKASSEDANQIFAFIQALAEYEKMSHCVTGTVEDLKQTVFVENRAEVLLAEEAGEAVGFALYFPNYSTFRCQPGIYLEDIYVKPTHRGKGYGKALFKEVATVAKKRGWGRMEWSCLNWNASAIAFYKSLGAVAQEEWTTYRLEEETLNIE